MKSNQTILKKIQLFLIENADPIQKDATQQHKTYLREKFLRIEHIEKYQNNHIKVVQTIGKFLEKAPPKKALEFFYTFGEKLGHEAVRDGLTIEEAIDGTIFLKQAIWKGVKTAGLITNLSIDEFYELNQRIGIYIDTLASKIAFTYHTQRQQIENNLKYLEEASRILSSSLDYQTTFNTIASLAVPRIGDWCTIDIVDDSGNIQQVAVAHKDPKKVVWAKKLRKQDPIDLNASYGVANVLRTGSSELYPTITDEMLVATAKNKDHLKLMRELGFTSALIVPLLSQKKPIGAITFITTETKRHYTSTDLRVAEELATRASVAIENAKLYKNSQEAISVRDEFISVASHELKTPITSVKMFTQVLKKHSEQIGDTKAVSHLSKMDKQINKLTELIYDLLNVSKIQAGKMEFSYNTFDFDTAIKEIIEILQQTNENHTIVLEGKTRKKVFGDEERIGQVVNNLISNAIKYSPKSGKVIITLSSDQKQVKVSVKDFGIGMEKLHLERIFDRFYRVYDTTDKTYPGLGIGLYISSEIVKRHGGKFWVESIPQKGSTFSFSLPIKGREQKRK